MDEGRNVYLDLLGFGILISLVEREYFKYIMLGSIGVAITIKLIDMAMEKYSDYKWRKSREKKDGSQL